MKNIKLIKDQIHGNILFSKIESDIYSSSIFNRLHHILQNSMTYLVYPTNKTSRFIHSVGVSKVASEIYLNGLKNSDEETIKTFLEDKKDIFKSSIEKDRLKLVLGVKAHSCQSIFFNNDHTLKLENLLEALNDIIGENFINHLSFSHKVFEDKSLLVVNILLMQSIRLFGLLHDFGHLPFSHLTEFAIGNVQDKLSDTDKESEFYKKLIELSDTDDDIHEVIGKKLTYMLLEYLKLSNSKDDNSDLECAKLIVYELFLNILKELHKGKNSRLYSLYEIISSDMDADRIDYTLRDGHASFLIEKGADTERIVQLYKLSTLKDPRFNDGFRFFPAIQSLSDIDEFFIDRFRLYKVVINHHKVKKFDYILQKVITDTLANEIKDSISIDDNGEISSLLEMLEIILELVMHKQENNVTKEFIEEFFYRFSQLTDYWLLSLLKKDMIKYLKDGTKTFEETRRKNLLDELFAGSKNFKSLWKRDYEFNAFIEELVEKVEASGVLTNGLFDDDLFKKLMADINKTKNPLEKGMKIIKFLNGESPNWLTKIEESFVGEEILLVSSKLAKPPENLDLIDLNNDNISDYSKVSIKDKCLLQEVDVSILFFAYFIGDVEIAKNSLIEKIVEYMGKRYK